MKKRIYTNFILILAIIFVGTGNAQENRKLAQTGMKFLSLSLDARASALGGALTAVEGNSLTMFYNPSTMGFRDQAFDVSAGQVSFIADINYIYGSAAYQPGQGEYGVFGVTFVSVDYGDLIGTIRAENEQGFLETGMFSPVAYAFGFGYAKSLTDQFSIGGNIKYVQQDLTGGYVNFDADQNGVAVETNKNVMVFDLGLLYRTGFKSLNFGMSIRNFAQEITYIEESFQLPLTFRIGLAMNMMDLTSIDKNVHSLLLTVEATHPRDFAEQVSFGAEYEFMNMFALRAGYSFPNDEHGFSAGVGFHKDISNYLFAIDYAYTPFGIFNEVHRFTIGFGFN
jgi:hypothetical protein